MTTGISSADDRQQILSALGAHWNPGLAKVLAMGARPVELRAEGSTVYGEDGYQAIDFSGSFGVFAVGHGNARVLGAVRHALQTAPVVPPGAVDGSTARLFELLTEILPAGLNQYVLGCSGSDATEVALRAAHLARPGRRRIVVAEDGYHGKTLAALAVTGQRGPRGPFEPLGADVVVVPYGDTAAARAALAGHDVAAVILEPVLGGTALTVPARGYIADVAQACTDAGTLFVADEIQCGFGRTGWMFAVERDNVTPDVMLLSKALTGGVMPIAVCAFTDGVLADAMRNPEWDPRLLDGTCTSALATAAAAASVEELRERDLPDRAAALGPRLSGGLTRLVERYPGLLVDAPGIGLMTGLRVREPHVELMLHGGLFARGVHIGPSLDATLHQPVLRVYPPLTCTEDEIDQVLEALDAVLAWIAENPPAA